MRPYFGKIKRHISLIENQHGGLNIDEILAKHIKPKQLRELSIHRLLRISPTTKLVVNLQNSLLT